MSSVIYRFGSFRLDVGSGVLTANGEPLSLGRRSVPLLAALLARRGEVVSKAELIDAAWGVEAVEEGNLSVQIATLRKILGKADDGKDWITTLARVGYGFRMAGEADPLTFPTDELRLPALAVLAFDNLSDDSAQQYFADGIVEDLIAGLSRFRSFAVIARNSNFAYRGRALDVRTLSRELGVQYVLGGSVRKAERRMRVSAQLIDGENGAHVWSQTWDGDAEDIFDVQDRITEGVAAIVEPRIGLAEIARSRRKRPQSIAAYDLYLRAQFALQVMSPASSARAFALFTEALLLEPENIMFLSGASEAIQNRISQGFPPYGPDDRVQCLDLARRGLRLASDDASAIALFGTSLIVAKEHELGLATVLRAAELNPNSLMVILSAGIACLYCGAIEHALAYFGRARRLGPNEVWQRFVLIGLAHVAMIEHKFDLALELAQQSLAIAQSYGKARWILIAATSQLGRLKEAQRHLAAFRTEMPGVTLGSIREGQPNLDPQRMVAILDGLRMAGLEEG